MTKRAEILDDAPHPSPSFEPGRIPRISRLPERAPTPAATEGFFSTSDSWNSSSVVVVSAQEPEGDSWNSSSVVVVLDSEFFRDSWNSCYKNSKNLRGARGKNTHAKTSRSVARRIPRTSRIWPGKNPHVKTVFCMSHVPVVIHRQNTIRIKYDSTSAAHLWLQ